MYKLYQPKDLDFGFVILNPDSNPNLLANTAKTIKNRYSGVPFVCSVNGETTAAEMKELKVVCPTYKGQKTFSSLVNAGMKHAPAEWNFLILSGTYLQPNLGRRFSLFVENDKDILFPVAGRKINFVDATINGLFVHKKTFKEVGDWDVNISLEACKTLWASDAIEKGCHFKAICGTKIC